LPFTGITPLRCPAPASRPVGQSGGRTCLSSVSQTEPIRQRPRSLPSWTIGTWSGAALDLVPPDGRSLRLLLSSREECLRLTAPTGISVGWQVVVAYPGDPPLVVPVDYTPDRDTNVFRTDVGYKLLDLRSGRRP
jgi:hypothetical protein